MRQFEVTDFLGESTIVSAKNKRDAIKLGYDWMGIGEWGEPHWEDKTWKAKKILLPFSIQEIKTAKQSEHFYIHEDPLPECPVSPPEEIHINTEEYGYLWKTPYELVGGCKTNPGVFSMGGTTLCFHYVCALSGYYMKVTKHGDKQSKILSEKIISKPNEESLIWVKNYWSKPTLPSWLRDYWINTLWEVKKESAKKYTIKTTITPSSPTIFNISSSFLIEETLVLRADTQYHHTQETYRTEDQDWELLEEVAKNLFFHSIQEDVEEIITHNPPTTPISITI